ncbi:MAG: 4Fe-4S dicluster domain-containing protein [Opitutaceae bacterium]|nr:4Fe-4S dicluster domain-containing protein [Opitutaceae bacterium]
MSAKPTAAPNKRTPAKSHDTTKGLPALRRTRIAAAALVFVIALAAFIDYRDFFPNHLKHIITSVQFVPSALTFAGAFHATSLACLVILGITLAIGRAYCSMLCPLGILQDIISRISAKIRRAAPYKLPHKKPQNILRYSILGAVILALVAGWGGLLLTWLDPYSNFGRIASTLLRPLAVVVNNIGATIATALNHPAAIPQVKVTFAAAGVLLPPLLILTALVIMAAFRGRLWCNTLCPVGAALGLVSRRALWRISLDKTTCRKCGACLRTCKSQCIDLRAGEVDFSRCVACYDCVSVCDEHSIKYRWHGLRARRESHDTQTSNPKSQIPNPKLQTPNPKSQIPATIARPPSSNRRAFITTAATGTLAAIGTTAYLATRRIAQNETPAPGKGRGNGHDGGNTQGSRHDFPLLDHPAVVTPPGAASTAHMLAQCTACQLCVSACPSRVIEPAVLQYGSLTGLMKPRLDFNKSFCNINCTVCTDVCPDGALTPLALEAKQTTRLGLAHVAHPRCIIVQDGTACGACAELCPTAALQMKKVPHHPDPLPVVDPRYCIGCGACQYACPTHPKAIVVGGVATHEKAEVLVQEQVESTTTEDFAF